MKYCPKNFKVIEIKKTIGTRMLEILLRNNLTWLSEQGHVTEPSNMISYLTEEMQGHMIDQLLTFVHVPQ